MRVLSVGDGTAGDDRHNTGASRKVVQAVSGGRCAGRRSRSARARACARPRAGPDPRAPHRAVGLGVVPAVREPAAGGQLLDVGERRAGAVPDVDPADAGVSIRSAPVGSGINSRTTVVWRPRPSPARTGWVAWRSCPSSTFTSVDLPAPETPSSTEVSPGSSSPIRAGRPELSGTLTAWASRRPTWRATRAARRSASGSRSALVSTSTGRTSPAVARAMMRSVLRRLGSGSASTTSATSTFAPSVWGRECVSTPARTMAPRRSSTTAIAPSASSATQSPVTGGPSGRSTARVRAVTSVAVPSRPPTSHCPRCWASTRPGTRSGSSSFASSSLRSGRLPSAAGCGSTA